MNRICETKKRNNNNGSALVIAIVIMMVVMMLSLALLLVSFSLSRTASGQAEAEQCREIAQGVSRLLEEEITGDDVDFETAEQMAAAVSGGEHPLWGYLRCNLWQNNWPYYDGTQSGHDTGQSWREFTMDTAETEAGGILENVRVAIYWEPLQTEKEDGAALFIRVSCEKGKQKSVITTEYDVTVEVDPADYGDGESICPEGICNPRGNWIQTGEKWSFSFAGRE